MGFHISISQRNYDLSQWMECHKFIDKIYYHWISEYEFFAERSCIFQTGLYFNIDVRPLTRLLHTNGEVNDKDLDSWLQTSDSLISLLLNLIGRIQEYPEYVKDIDYDCYADDRMKVRSSLIGGSPWNEYVMSGKLTEHLKVLLDMIECYKKQGNDRVIITAG